MLTRAKTHAWLEWETSTIVMTDKQVRQAGRRGFQARPKPCAVRVFTGQAGLSAWRERGGREGKRMDGCCAQKVSSASDAEQIRSERGTVSG